MKRLIVTSGTFKGQAEIFYKGTVLDKIDFSSSEMNEVQRFKFKEMVPIQMSGLQEAFSKTNVTIVECDYEVSFDMFWTKYNRKINRKRAESIFGKLSKSNQVAAYFGVDAYDRYLKAESWRSKADPEKYLKDEYWNNEWSK